MEGRLLGLGRLPHSQTITALPASDTFPTLDPNFTVLRRLGFLTPTCCARRTWLERMTKPPS